MINPQLAARILPGLADWATLEANRGELARQALQKLAKTSRVSLILWTFQVERRLGKTFFSLLSDSIDSCF